MMKLTSITATLTGWSKKCDFTIYYGNKQNVYLSYKSQFGVLTFNLKEEGETKYLLSQLLSK